MEEVKEDFEITLKETQREIKEFGFAKTEINKQYPSLFND